MSQNKLWIHCVLLSIFSLVVTSAEAKVKAVDPRIRNEKNVKPFDEKADEVVRELAGLVQKNTTQHSVALVELKPGKSSVEHQHLEREETYYVLEGKGQLRLDGGEPITLRAGDLIAIPPKTRHKLTNNSPKKKLKLLVTCAAPWIFEDFHPTE